MAEISKMMQKRAVKSIRRIVDEACTALRQESEKLCRAIEWEAGIDLAPDLAKQALDPDDRPLDPAKAPLDLQDQPELQLDLPFGRPPGVPGEP
jgi:hypothetical protein